jgi:hypothetical protein
MPVCVGAAAAGVLMGCLVRISVAPGRTSTRHALHARGTGAIASCAPGQFALGQTRSGGLLALGLGRPPSHVGAVLRESSQRFFIIPGGGAAAAAGAGGEQWRRLTGFDPLGCLAANCSGVLSRLDRHFFAHLTWTACYTNFTSLVWRSPCESRSRRSSSKRLTPMVMRYIAP